MTKTATSFPMLYSSHAHWCRLVVLALLDFHYFFFFGLRCRVDFAHVAVGELLDLFVGAAVFVLADELFLHQFFYRFVTLAADIAYRYAVVFRHTVQLLDEFLAPRLGHLRT